MKNRIGYPDPALDRAPKRVWPFALAFGIGFSIGMACGLAGVL